LYTTNICKGRRGRDRMVVRFATTYAISAYRHWYYEFESRSVRGAQAIKICFSNFSLPYLYSLWISSKQNYIRYMAVQCLKELMSIYKGTSKKLLMKTSDFSAVEFRLWNNITMAFYLANTSCSTGTDVSGITPTSLCDKVCQWLATGRWFTPGPPVSSTNKHTTTL
jgi:hypothetical protein